MHLENALQDGAPLFIEDCVEEIDPNLDNVLAKNIVKTGGMFQVSLAVRDVIHADGFRIYFTTKLPNPKFSPETFSKTAVIELSVPQHGLEEQLQNLAILGEKENLEKEREGLHEQVGELKQVLVDVVNQLLDQLRRSEGNLLENTLLISTLANPKTKSEENKESLASALETNEKINNSCEDYLPVAVGGAVLYFRFQANH